MRWITLGFTGAMLAVASTAALGDGYQQKVEEIEKRRQRWKAEDVASAQQFLENSAIAVSQAWLGTTWALGAPQTKHPGQGQINCGTFVGTVLRDIGFRVNVSKLQRQPSQLIIQSFTPHLRKFSRTPIDKFLSAVRDMGPGLYIVGLDFHVGFLRVTSEDVRFIHASYIHHYVINEDASSAKALIDSQYRVVGRILTEQNARDWIAGRAITVKGNW
ncbi:MAG: hypothetical protein KDA60_21055 [Planctomycetales bacterium]|nr:hypothetical protein [Planctomycetales bacterium]